MAQATPLPRCRRRHAIPERPSPLSPCTLLQLKEERKRQKTKGNQEKRKEDEIKEKSEPDVPRPLRRRCSSDLNPPLLKSAASLSRSQHRLRLQSLCPQTASLQFKAAQSVVVAPTLVTAAQPSSP